MNRRGSVDDVLFIMVFTFVFAISILFGYFLMSTLNTEIQGVDEFSTEGKAIMSSSQGRYVALFDNVFIVVLVILVIATLFLASQVDTHPIFFPLTLIIFAFMSVVGAVAANTYDSVASSPSLATYAADLTVVPYVMNHFVQFILGFGFLVAIVLYGKTQ